MSLIDETTVEKLAKMGKIGAGIAAILTIIIIIIGGNPKGNS